MLKDTEIMLFKIIGDLLTLLAFLVITIVVGLIVIGLTALNNHFMDDEK